jgi:hypothetical protein
MFRELRFGAMFIVSAAIGAFVGMGLWGDRISYGPEEHVMVL